jgi:hypothetical protein
LLLLPEITNLLSKVFSVGDKSVIIFFNSPVAEVSALLGHKDSYVTLKIYTHFTRAESTANTGVGDKYIKGCLNVSSQVSIASPYARLAEIAGKEK